MYFYIFLLIPYVPNVFSYSYDDVQNKADYGPYVVEYGYFNLTYQNNTSRGSPTARITKDKDKFKLHMNATVLSPFKIDEVKIFVYRMDKTKNLLWNYRVKHPCQHYALAGIIREYYNVDNNCVLQTGTYTCVMNLTDLTKSFFGTSFFLGDFEFKVTLISKKLIILSINTMISFKKKP